MALRHQKVTAAAAAACAATALAAVALPAATTASGVAACATSQLHVSLGQFDGGVGHGGYPIIFKNTGAACSMKGYPGVDGLSASGATVVSAQRTLYGYLGGTHKIATVVVAHGKTASAFFEGLNFAATSQPCHKFAALLITPPNETHSVKISPADPVCYPQIHPVVAGSSGTKGL